MRTTLQNIADIRTGYTFRGKIEEVDNGNVRVLQIKDLRRQYTELNQTKLNVAELPLIHFDLNKGQGGNSATLSPGDVVLPARGEHYNASIFPKADSSSQHFSSQKVIATSQLLIIKTIEGSVLSEYLCWAINRPIVQHYLLRESRGTNIPLLSGRSLAKLLLNIPPLETQEKIVELQQLWDQVQQLNKQLMANREKQLKGMFKTLLKENRE